VWVPRRFLTNTGVRVDNFREYINERIAGRGMILPDGQIITSLMPDNVEVIFDGDHAWECPSSREWAPIYQSYFGLAKPYQLSEEDDVLTSSHVMWRVPESYVRGDERIVGILHGLTDDYYFTCPCHYAEVVYTTHHRLVCIGCGFLHAVLLAPLQFRHYVALTAQEWIDFFDPDGARREEPVRLSVIDFRDVEHAPMLWVTDFWLDAKHEFIFFARSPKDVIREAIRGTERDPTIFAEAGWTPVPMGPSPVDEIADASMEIGLLQNAAAALGEGAAYYASARMQPDHIVYAIPDLFRAIELILKAKLHELDAQGLDDRPRTTTVIKRLGKLGVPIAQSQRAVIDAGRRLRNHLQHGTATFNQRDALRICRDMLIFIDRFSIEKLDLWIGDAIAPAPWKEVLKIREIATTATAAADALLSDARTDSHAEITVCNSCGNATMLRPHPRTGASCVYCAHIPVET